MDGIHIHVTTHAKTYTNTNIIHLIFDDTLVIQLLLKVPKSHTFVKVKMFSYNFTLIYK